MYISNGWDHLPFISIPDNFEPTSKASIIIAARNEETCIARCIDSIYNNNLAIENYEIIVVDDHSEDSTPIIVSSRFPQVTLIKLDITQGKKAAIEKGVESSQNKLCIVTDADCEVGKSWIKYHLWLYENGNTSFHAGPVLSTYHNTILSGFQVLDFISMSLIVGNGISRKHYYIANGANMAFDKSAYMHIGGMKSHIHIPSGDDMFLINEMSQHDEYIIQYLKNADSAVITQSENTWRDFFKQRKRWAAKTRHLPISKGYYIQVFVMMVHFIILLNFIMIPWSNGLTLFSGVLFLIVKACIDYLFLAKGCRHYGLSNPIRHFFLSFLIYFFYIFYMSAVALFAKDYHWKGREVS